jgi:hypothetical protein
MGELPAAFEWAQRARRAMATPDAAWDERTRRLEASTARP